MVLVEDLITKVEGYLPNDRIAFVRKAYAYATRAHEGQNRLSGEPFVQHPIETAKYLADLHMDATTLAGALLHDTIEDCGATYEDLEYEFGSEVARLVDGVTKLNRFESLGEDASDRFRRTSGDGLQQAASLRKMLIAMAKDLRVVLVKLADRLHNMRTLKAQPHARQIAIAQETLDIYAPLAHRLGMWDMKWQLEDLSFRYIDPISYKQVALLLATRRAERERYVSRVSEALSSELEENSIEALTSGRAKHIYSTHQKIQAYAVQGKDFPEIYDLFALRILVEKKQECYAALGVVHSLWNPLPGQFDDYIAKPKENMYQGLHTTVMGPEGMPLEVQIRTHAMHQVSEYGVAAHWRYKEGSPSDSLFERRMTWFRQLLEWQRDISGAEEFLENVKADLFPDQVFVYTPKGDIKELPAESTTIDFAYRVHTDLGHRCIGAKANSRLVPLDYQLQNGDTIEILTSKIPSGPSLDWLNPDSGYVRSAAARQRIRAWFRRQARSGKIQRGEELLTRELRRLDMRLDEDELARFFEFNTLDEFLEALGSGVITVNQVFTGLTQEQEKIQEETEHQDSMPWAASGIEVLGVGDMWSHLAPCCSPIPGDVITGLIMLNKGITIHRKDCSNLLDEDGPGRLIQVDWGTTKRLHPVRLSIEAWDRVGLLRDVTALVSSERVNIASLITRENEDRTANIQLTLFTTGVTQLSRLFAKLEGIQGVISASRATIV